MGVVEKRVGRERERVAESAARGGVEMKREREKERERGTGTEKDSDEPKSKKKVGERERVGGGGGESSGRDTSGGQCFLCPIRPFLFLCFYFSFSVLYMFHLTCLLSLIK